MRTRILAGLRQSAVGVVALVALTACGGKNDAPFTPKDVTKDVALTIDLATPNANDGAVLFEIIGPSAVTVTARPELQVDQDIVTANGVTTATVTIRGELTDGAIGSFTVPGASADGYAIRLRQAAADARGSYANRTNLNAYRLALRRQG